MLKQEKFRYWKARSCVNNLSYVFYIRYRSEELPTGPARSPGEHFLIPTHSHFLMVDDGNHGWYSKQNYDLFQNKFFGIFRVWKKGAKIKFQDFIVQYLVFQDYFRIPVVTLLLGGDLNTLVSLRQRLQNGYFVLIVGGTGGLADVLQEGLDLLTRE